MEWSKKVNDCESSHEKLMREKFNSFSLCSSKLVYSRDVDPNDTMIIRNLYQRIAHNKRIFGLKGVQHIETLFLCLIAMFKDSMDQLRGRIKYVRNEEFEELLKVFTRKEDRIQGLGRVLLEKKLVERGKSIARFNGSSEIKIEMNASADFPNIVLINENHEKNTINSVSLFVGEAIKLLKYLNSRFNFTRDELLKVQPINFEIYETDNFF